MVTFWKKLRCNSAYPNMNMPTMRFWYDLDTGPAPLHQARRIMQYEDEMMVKLDGPTSYPNGVPVRTWCRHASWGGRESSPPSPLPGVMKV